MFSPYFFNIEKYLAGIEPFRRLPEPELERLGAESRFIQFRKGETIFAEGHQAGWMFVLQSGGVDIHKYTSQGRPSTIENIRPGIFFGILCRLGSNGNKYTCTAVAAKDSLAIRIPDQLFFQYFKQHGAFATGICLICSDKLNMMQEKTAISKESVDYRIIKTLSELADQHGNVLPVTKRQIAELSATTVETAIRTLSSFRKKHLISSSRGQIVLKDRLKLEALLESRS